MANVTQVNRVHLKVNESKEVTMTGLAPSDVGYLDLRGADYKTCLLFTNTNTTAAKVTIAIGDGIQGVGDPIEFTVAQNKYQPVVVDSGAYKITDGTSEFKGYAKVTVTSGVQVAVIELP